MTLNNLPNTFLKPFRNVTLIRNTCLTASTLFLAACLLAPASATTRKLTGKWDPMATISMQIALQPWSNPGEQPDLLPGLLGNDQLESLADEAGKQAQLNYLSNKWGQPTKTVRQCVNLARAEDNQPEGLEP